MEVEMVVPQGQDPDEDRVWEVVDAPGNRVMLVSGRFKDVWAWVQAHPLWKEHDIHGVKVTRIETGDAGEYTQLLQRELELANELDEVRRRKRQWERQ